jgi:hypothetical protein
VHRPESTVHVLAAVVGHFSMVEAFGSQESGRGYYCVQQSQADAPRQTMIGWAKGTEEQALAGCRDLVHTHHCGCQEVWCQ